MLENYQDLPPELEAIVSSVIGCAISVHRELGPGFKELIYHTAMNFNARLLKQGLQRVLPLGPREARLK